VLSSFCASCSPRVSQDTFLDAAHLESSFPGRQVVYSNLPAGAAALPPFRITFPELAREGAADDAGKRKADTDGHLPPLIVEVR
jgi:hypothetical protein